MLVAPNEPAVLYSLGHRDLTPERFGVDILFAATGKLIGIQRKAFPGDFLASIEDGRLEKQVNQMQALDIAVLCVEGKGSWTTEGELIYSWGAGWNRSKHRRYLCSIKSAGIWVEQTDDPYDTIRYAKDLKAWAEKPYHNSVRHRPPVKRNEWGKLESRQFQSHLIQSLPDIGPELAERIIDTHGFPFRLVLSAGDLMQVDGIGPKKAEKIVRAFTEGP